jgi:phosphatidylglycerophosphatase C
MTQAAPVVAFDVDGTLTWTDSFMLFLRWFAGPSAFAAKLARIAPDAAFAKAKFRSRDEVKALAARLFFTGVPEDRFVAAAVGFAEAVLPQLERADARARLFAHRTQGHHVMLVSASLEDYLRPWAVARLGLSDDDVLGARLERENGVLTGRLLGPNCRAEEKVVRLRAACGPDLDLLAAYGDSSGDDAMLAAARGGGKNVFHDAPEGALLAAARLYIDPRR